MEIYVNRLLRERGTIMGTLKVVKEVAGEGIELVKVCGTVEREADCLPAGKYRVRIGKCKRLNRKMPYLVPVDDASAKSVAMIQPGNGPLFTTLYERIKKAVWRGNVVTLEIKEM